MSRKLTLTFLIILVLFLLGMSFYYVKTNVFDKPTFLTVVGEGKAKTDPELAQFTLSLAATGKTSFDAMEAEKNLRQKIITLLTGLYNIEKADLQVSYPRVSVSSSGNTIYYSSVNSINVKFKRLGNFDAAIEKLYQLGNVNVSNIILTTENPRDLEDQAISKAFADGKERAEKMAQSAGKNLGRLVSVTGQQTQAVGTITREASTEKGSEAAPGQIEITRNVTLVYEMR